MLLPIWLALVADCFELKVFLAALLSLNNPLVDFDLLTIFLDVRFLLTDEAFFAIFIPMPMWKKF
jgi:hypothetical protein